MTKTMTLKYVVMIGVMAAILLIPTMYVSARDLSEKERESGFFYEDGGVKSTKDRPAINPDLDPDEDCNLAYELKCIPGSLQKCSDLGGYENGEDNVCTPIDCQEGYHEEEDNESGLCYPDSEGCPEGAGYVLVQDEDGEGMYCRYLFRICDEPEHSSKDYCMEFCENNPDYSVCKDRPAMNVELVLALSDRPEIVDPIETERGTSACPEGYSRTDDGEKCQLKDVQCDEEPDNSLCNGERGRGGTIFCDIQYQEEGSKSSCYDRNDDPE